MGLEKADGYREMGALGLQSQHCPVALLGWIPTKEILLPVLFKRVSGFVDNPLNYCLLILLILLYLKTLSSKLCLISYMVLRKLSLLHSINMNHSLLKYISSMARRKIIYMREAVNYSIDVCCFIGFSLPISVTAFPLFFRTSAHYFMQLNWF